MNNLLNQIFKSLLYSLTVFIPLNIHSQCNPEWQEECDVAKYYFVCSLNELNGYQCSNYSLNSHQCVPMCSQGGIGNNTTWWSFVSGGGAISITLQVGTCTLNQGLQLGLYGDCSCHEEVACHTVPCVDPGTSYTINGNLTPCQPYLFWINGCLGDLCDFTLSTTGGGQPSLSPLGKINNIPSMIIEPICEGECNVRFFVNPQPGGCKPTYIWSIDGETKDGNGNEIFFDMTDAGDYTLCVSAQVRNESGGPFCAQVGQQCATVKVRRISDKIGPQRKICNEQAKGTGFKWHSNRIKSSGIYHAALSDSKCCNFDSIVEFIVMDAPIPESVYYLSCDNTPYIDLFGKKHYPCLQQSSVLLPKSSKPYGCDSTILLSAVSIDFNPKWKATCYNSMIQINPQITITKPCYAGETYRYLYKWYKKNDPAKTPISFDEQLEVDPVKENYCLELTVVSELGTAQISCVKTFCEDFDESNLTPPCFRLNGNNVFCVDTAVVYWMDSFHTQDILNYSWKINGGQIISNSDSTAIKVKWNFNQNDTGLICASYAVECGVRCERCLQIVYDTKIAGKDFEKRGLSAYLKALAHPNGTWRFISGPNPVRIENIKNPNTQITASTYGYYCFEWSIVSSNCTLRDTICVDLHFYTKANPEYPNYKLDFRESTQNNGEEKFNDFFTPNLIKGLGATFISFTTSKQGKIQYYWYDVFGQQLMNEQLNTNQSFGKFEIKAPQTTGIYYLLIELDGLPYIRKICILD